MGDAGAAQVDSLAESRVNDEAVQAAIAAYDGGQLDSLREPESEQHNRDSHGSGCSSNVAPSGSGYSSYEPDGFTDSEVGSAFFDADGGEDG